MKHFRIPADVRAALDKFFEESDDFELEMSCGGTKLKHAQFVSAITKDDLERWMDGGREFPGLHSVDEGCDCVRLGYEMHSFCQDVENGLGVPQGRGRYWVLMPSTGGWFGFNDPKELWDELKAMEPPKPIPTYENGKIVSYGR